MQVEEQYFNDIYRTCSDLKRVLEDISDSEDLKRTYYYIKQAYDYVVDVQQLISTLHMIMLNQQDSAIAMKRNLDQMILDFDDEEE